MSQIIVHSSGSSGGTPIEQITPSQGIVVVPDGSGNINAPGTLPIVTTGTANTLTISVNSATTSAQGVVELATDAETIAGVDSSRSVVPSALAAKLGTQDLHAVPYGLGTSSAFGWSSAGTDGQILIAGSGLPAEFADLTSVDNTITFTPGANALDLSAAASLDTLVFDADSGTASPSSGTITFAGGTNIGTSGVGSTVTINLEATIPVSLGGTGIVTTTAYAPICGGTTATGNFQAADSNIATSGYVLTSNGNAALPSWEAPAGGGLSWSVITADQSAVAGEGYICNKASALVLTLPASGAIGDTIAVTGINTALGWQIAQNANQQIHFGTSSTTVGATGYLQSSATRDSVEIVCVVSGSSAEWNVVSSIGNITVN